MQKPLFDIVSIMRNEAVTLPRLLKSLEDFKNRGGKYYILDTGSTDDSVKIARDWGCIVEEVGEKYLHVIDKDFADKINERFIVDGDEDIVKEGDKYFDFSAARNAASALAEQDWTCTVDCDEELTKLDIDKINEIITNNPNVSHFEYEFVFAHGPDGRPYIQFIQSKFFNKKKMQWLGRVHEMVSPIEGKGGDRLYLPPDIFFLEHWQQPHERHSYLKGLAVDCYLEPTKDRNSHYCGRELMYNGRCKSAIKEFERHIAMNGWTAERAQSMIFIGDCWGTLGDNDKRCEWYWKSFHLDPTRRVSLMKLADYHLYFKNYQAAIAYAEAALTIPWNAFYANDKSMYEDAPHAILYKAYGWSGNIPKAQEHILKALEYHPYHPEYLRDTKYYFEYGDQGIQGWMKFPELQWLYETAKTVDSILEIGSWKGRSTNALLSGCKGTVTACDTFEGSDDASDLTYWMAGQENIKEQFVKNVGNFENLEVLHMTSEDASKSSMQAEMIFIDATHTYEGVKKDIELWKDRATKILCGHDFDEVNWAGVCKAVRETLGEPDEVHGTIWVKYVYKT